MTKKPKVTCWECKKVFRGEAACTTHAKDKKHQWRTPSIPLPSYSPSVSTSTLSNQATIGYAPSIFVASNIAQCPVCFQLLGTWDALTVHYSVFHPGPYLTRPTLHPCSICQEFVTDKMQHYWESPRHPKCTACDEGFENAEALQRHLATRDTCDVCNAHLLPSVTMDDHYQMSEMHPACTICGMSFRGLEEFQWHCRDCPPATTPETMVETDSLSNVTIGSPTVYQHSGPAANHVAHSDGQVDNQTDTDGAFWEATASGPSVTTDSEEPQEYVLRNTDVNHQLEEHSTTSVKAVDLEPSWNDASSWENDASISNGASVDDETPPSPTHTEVSLPPFDTDSNTSQTTVSWHCRSCLEDPCQDPVTTLCGHIFCKGCILIALSTYMACPVCAKTFLISLDVGRG